MSLSREDLLDVLRTASNRGYLGIVSGSASSGPAGGDSGTSAAAGGFKFAGEAAEKLGRVLGVSIEETYGTFKKVANQNYSIADAGKTVQNMLGEFGSIGQAAGAVFGDLTTYGKQTVDAWRDVSEFGAAFGSDAIGMRTAGAQTRMSFEEYTEFLKKNKDNLASFGGTVTEGAKKFNDMSKDFFDAGKGIDGAGEKLRLMGMKTEEVNEILALNMQSNRLVNLQDKEARTAALKSTGELAVEMDSVAKLTGKSRREQEAALAETNKDVQWQAEQKLALKNLSDKERVEREASMNYMKNSTNAMGSSISSLAKGMAIGKLTEADMKQMAALGPAANKLQEAIDASKKATDETSKLKAKELMDEAQAAIIAQQNTEEYLTNQKMGIAGWKEGAESTQKLSMSLDGTLVEMNAARKQAGQTLLDMANPEDAKKVREAAMQKIKDEQDRKDKPGAGTTEAMIVLENRARDAGAAINEHLVQPLNEQLGKELRKRTGKSDSVPFLQGNRDESDRSARQRTAEFIERNIPIGSIQTERTGPNAPVNPRDRDRPNVLPRRGEGSNSESSSMSNIVDLFKATTLQVDKMVGPGFAKGTLGTTGSLFENFGSGTLATLHGREAVITEEQMQNLIKGASTGLSAAAQSVEPMMRGGGGLSDVAIKLDQLNSNILKLIDISYTTAENSGKQIKATRGLGGNLFA